MKTSIKIIIGLSLLGISTLIWQCDRAVGHEAEAIKGSVQEISFTKTSGIPVSDFADSISYLSLDVGDEIIGEVSKVVYTDERYFLSDRTTGAILIFDKSGVLEFSIRKLGDGPEEYDQLTDFFVDEKKQTLTVFSRATQVLMEMDYTGRLLSKTMLGHYLEGLSPVGGGDFLTFGISSDRVNGQERPSGVSLLNTQGGLKNVNLHRFPGDLASNNAYQYRYFHRGVDDKHYILTASDTLFVFTADNGIRSEYVLKFGEKSIPDRLQNKPNTVENTVELMTGGYVRSKDHFLDGGDFLTFHVTDNEYTYFAMYAKEKQAARYSNALIDDINGLPLTFPIANDGGKQLFSVLPQETLVSTLKAYQDFKSQIIESKGEEGYRSMVSRLSGLVNRRSEVLAVIHTH